MCGEVFGPTQAEEHSVGITTCYVNEHLIKTSGFTSIIIIYSGEEMADGIMKIE